MDRYAILIQEDDLALITLLNQGVTPVSFAGTPTYFVFDAEWNSEVHNEILAEEDVINKNQPHISQPTIYRLK